MYLLCKVATIKRMLGFAKQYLEKFLIVPLRILGSQSFSNLVVLVYKRSVSRD